MSTLQLNPERISELADLVAEQIADHPGYPPLVVVSGALYKDPKGVDAARFQAALATANGSYIANAAHIFMVDGQTPHGVAQRLADAGAIVVPVAKGEGGVARPYITAALIIDELVRRGVIPPEVRMVKAEAEKNIFGKDTPQYYLDQCQHLDIATGVRTNQTWYTMPGFLATTESVLGFIIGDALGISHDTPSGVLVLSAAGRRLLVETTTVQWEYLIKVPYEGVKQRLQVGEFDINFSYHPAVVAEENGNHEFDVKRHGQLVLMGEHALKLTKDPEILDPKDTTMLLQLMQRFSIGLGGVKSVSAS